MRQAGEGEINSRYGVQETELDRIGPQCKSH